MTALQKHPFIAWFANNPVVANILMISIMSVGLFTSLTIRKEGFPAFGAESVEVKVPILGGTPEDVERGVAIKIEEALQSVDGVDHISSVSSNNLATITVEAKEGYPINKLLADVKTEVDAIPSLPEQAENPIVRAKEIPNQVLWVELYGTAPEAVRKEAARNLRDELLRQSAISQVDSYGVRDYEISIEPSEEKLRRYNMTFAELANAVTQNSLDLGGGVVRAQSGDISLRARSQAYTQKEFEEIPLRTSSDGTRVLVRDVAEVRDAFVDQKFLNRFRGEPTTSLKITTEGRDDILKAVKQAEEVVKNYTDLPEGVKLASWLDGATNIRDRLVLLGNNGGLGVLLVLLILTIFLNLRLAFWVAIGIPLSLAGAITLFPLPGIDLSVNVISAFGFLVVLGIVVDDAIVIGESIYSAKKAAGEPKTEEEALETTVLGVSRVVTPATFGVVTTIAAFLPLTQISGRLGNIFGQIATVVILCLIFSLLESKLILPAHLAHINVHRKPKNILSKAWSMFQGGIAGSVVWFVSKVYSPTLRFLVPWRYSVLGFFVAVFIIVVGLIPAGSLRFVFFPNIYTDNASAVLKLNQGQSVDYLHSQAQYIADKAEELGAQYKKEFGHNPFKEIQISASTNILASVSVELSRSAEREFLSSAKIVQDWRALVGPVSGARSLDFAAKAGPPGGDVSIKFESDDLNQLQAVARELKGVMQTYPGVFDISDSFNSGKPEILYSINPEGQAAGITKRDLAMGVRDAFFGREAQRVQRGRDEVKVMVRYPLEKRGSLETLRQMRIRTEEGASIPFSTVADTHYSSSLASIERYDNKRVVTVNASVDKTITSSEDVLARLEEEYFPQMKSQYAGLSISQSGEAEQRQKSMKSLMLGFGVSIVFIYILIAIPLKSYVTPLIIMSVIPFGIIGALLGHVAIGIPVSILSIFGILALSGVVVNDSLVFVCAINDLRAKGGKLKDACLEAGSSRFRAILLTSLTTFFGLAPLLLEKEVQAQFLKPMAASLAFGILFATIITLVLLPMLLLIAKDIKTCIVWFFRW